VVVQHEILPFSRIVFTPPSVNKNQSKRLSEKGVKTAEKDKTRAFRNAFLGFAPLFGVWIFRSLNPY
jgi:hypothetical protein